MDMIALGCLTSHFQQFIFFVMTKLRVKRMAIIVRLPPVSPRLARSPTRRSGGAEVDMGDDASVVRRRGRVMGPGASYVITMTRQLAKSSHIGGVPLTNYLGSATQVCTWEHVSLFC